MSFATLANFLIAIFKAAPALAPLILQLLDAISNALNKGAESGAVKLKALAPLNADHYALGDELSALSANSGFDGHRIANLLQFALQHPMILMGVLKAFGITIPPELLALLQQIMAGGGQPAPAPAGGGTTGVVLE